MRPAFSMMTAVFVVILISTLTLLVFSLSPKTVQETGAQYRNEQAALLARSYTEFAIMAIQAQLGTSNSCLREIAANIDATQLGVTNGGGTARGEGYQVSVDISYIGLPNTVTCPTGNQASTSNDISAIVDVTVRYKDFTVIPVGGDINDVPWTRFFRRTLQVL